MKHKIITALLIFLGLCSQSNSQLKIDGGAIFKTSGNVSVVVTDADFENNGDFIQDTLGSLRFSGTQNSAIKGHAIAKINNLEMTKDNNATLLLNNQVKIGKAVSFISGLIDLNGYNVLLDSNATIAGESEANHFIGSKGGYIQISRSLNASTRSNVGNLGAIISSQQSIGFITVRRGHTTQSSASFTKSVSRIYTLIPKNNIGLNVSLRLTYLDSEKNNLDENTFAMYKLGSNGISWNKVLQTTANPLSNYVEKIGLNSLGTYTISAPVLVSKQVDITGVNIVVKATEQKIIAGKTAVKETHLLQPKLTVGPNPNKGNFFFQVNGMEQSTPALLYTIDGKLIGQYKINDGLREQVKGLKTGTYLLKVEGIQPYKVVVQ